MSRIPQSFIDELIARTDIVEVIGSRVQLKKQGREYKACCPFHNEKTPSFWVSPEKQFYHCFGCGAHGTALGFLMEHDKLSFPEAVEDLASRLGLEVPREGGADNAPRRVNADSYDLMARVARFYSEALARSERAKQYAAKRGLTKEIIDRFGIGYAPNSWNEVLRRFGGNDAARRQLLELGLIVERPAGQARTGERYYDRFRDRLMFPIRDVRGRVIAFGGRVIDQGEPKYLNSPETTLFHKGRELYGLYEALQQNRSHLSRLMIVEGYMDVVRLHQHGVTYAVATLGTATTAEHLKYLFRRTSDVVFAFDGDRAGRSAAWRALMNALPEAQEGRVMRFLFIPEGHDPDTLIAEEGREAFEKRITEQSLLLSQYVAKELAERITVRGADGQARLIQTLRPMLEQMPEVSYRRLVAEQINQTFGFKLTPEQMEHLIGVRLAPAPTVVSAGPRSAGRGSLVRQAMLCLLWFPSIATQVTPEERAGIEGVEEPGADLLRQLLDHLQAEPAQVSAQVLQRWADKPGHEAFEKLLRKECVIPDAAAAVTELRAALVKMADAERARRLQALKAKSLTGPLSEAELQEFQRLTTRRAAAPGPR
ncbi:MAG TPA: DNA primase [Steroidobacteraceae bacterium]